MSEKDSVEKENEEVQETEEQGLSEVEQEAYEKGWRPEEEYEGDSWIAAEEFIARAPLYEGLSKANKRIKSMEATLKQLAAHNQGIEKASYEKAKAELKKERITALEREDYNKAIELEDKVRQLEQEAPVDQPQETQSFLDWREENPWYGDDQRITMYADKYGETFRADNPEMSEADFYKEVTKEVKAAFPDKFNKPLPNRGNPSGAQGGGSKKGVSFSKLTPLQKKLGRELIEVGALTEEEYIKQLKDMGELEKV